MTAVAVNLSVAQCKAREHSEDELQLWEQQQDTLYCGSGQSLRSPVQSSRAQRRRAAALGTATRYICR